MKESELIYHCIRNDRKAQQDLYQLYYAPMMALCLRYSKNKEQATQMFREGFVKVFESLGSYKNSTPFEDWLREFFARHAVAFLKNLRQEYFVTTTVRAEEKKDQTDLFNQADLDDYTALSDDDYIKALQQLPPSFRAVFNLSVVDGYQPEKVSDIMEAGSETIRQNLERARFAFQKNIQSQLKGY